MTESQKPSETFVFDLDGGRLCLDFANTVSGTRGSPKERLTAYADVVSWALQVGVATEAQANQLRSKAQRHPKLAAIVLKRARELREVIFRIFTAMIGGREPEKGDLDLLNRDLSRALAHLRLVKESQGLLLKWDDLDSLDWILWAVAKSAADLLSSDEIDRVHRCGAEGECDWLFFDETRNRSRRWCSMKDCGNRAKARRHYDRLKKSG